MSLIQGLKSFPRLIAWVLVRMHQHRQPPAGFGAPSSNQDRLQELLLCHQMEKILHLALSNHTQDCPERQEHEFCMQQGSAVRHSRQITVAWRGLAMQD